MTGPALNDSASLEPELANAMLEVRCRTDPPLNCKWSLVPPNVSTSLAPALLNAMFALRMTSELKVNCKVSGDEEGQNPSRFPEAAKAKLGAVRPTTFSPPAVVK